MAQSRSSKTRSLFKGLAFLSPNILGFLSFTLLPLIFSLVMAFTNWDLKLHNMFKNGPLKFIGLANFSELFHEPHFWQYLGNTLFMMMAIPFSIAGALFSAVLLSKNPRGGSRPIFLWLLASLTLFVGCVMMVLAGAGQSAMMLLMMGLLGGTLLFGAVGGNSVYRTLFYLPNFTSGVATYLLWKKMYATHDAPINNALTPVLGSLADGVNATPSPLIAEGGILLCLGLILLVLVFGLRRLRLGWRDGDAGITSVITAGGFLLLPVVIGVMWWPVTASPGIAAVLPNPATIWGGAIAFFLSPVRLLALTAVLVLVRQTARVVGKRRDFKASSIGEGFGTSVMMAIVLMVGIFVLLGIGKVLYNLPVMARDGLEPPGWINSYDWAKPALMFVGFWAAVGSNNMLLYLAALTNVPDSLYEAADIDGASRFQKFWNVTWPQLAPTTFFIVVMSMIGGLQGGFEMAKAMTAGGPAGSTTVLSYYVYQEGFETGRLGYSSAIAWTMFGMIFVITMINWRFGNRYVND